MIKRLAPVGLILSVACGGGDGPGPGPVTNPNDISSMAVGDGRVLNPADITSGIDVPAGSGARDYVIIVGNTASIKDAEVSYVVKADKSTGATFGISALRISARARHAVGQIPLARTPQQAVEKPGARVRAQKLAMKSAAGGLRWIEIPARSSAQAAAMLCPSSVK